MKRFTYCAVSILCLAIAVLIGFNVWSQKVEAQAGPEIVGFSTMGDNVLWVICPNGDVYYRGLIGNISTGFQFNESLYPNAVHMGNFWGGAVSADQSTWSDIKDPKK